MCSEMRAQKYASLKIFSNNIIRFLFICTTLIYSVNNELLKTRSYQMPLDSISLYSGDTYKKGEVTYRWTQIMGPHHLTLVNVTQQISSISNLKIGFYAFQVQIQLRNSSRRFSKIVQIEIFDKINQKPKADAGGDRIVYLPVKTIKLLGSSSSDDKGIVMYHWKGEKGNPAGLETIGHTDRQPNLLLRKPSPGRYVFKLTVQDYAGLRDSNRMTLIVKKNKNIKNVVQIHFMANLRNLTFRNLKNIKSQIYLILSKSIQNIKLKIIILRFQPDPMNGFALLEFYVISESTGAIFSASNLIRILRPIILDDINIFMHPVVQITTPDCLRSCFIHGYCNSENNKCICDMFWINNLWADWVNEHSSKDCEWNIFYTSIAGLLIMFVTFISCRQLYQSLWSIPSCGLTPSTKIT